MRTVKILFVAISIIFLFTNCPKKDNGPIIPAEDSIYYFVNDVMNNYYLWYDQVPELDIYQYKDPVVLLEDLKYKPIDKWSFIGNKEKVSSLFEEGEYFGFGFYIKYDINGDLRVTLVYENTEANTKGIKRSDLITHINNIPVADIDNFDAFFDSTPVTWTFRINGVDISLIKTTITQNAVLVRKIITQGDKIIGYIVLDSFLKFADQELVDACQFFKENNITDLIIDLRYNGGGYSTVAENLANMIIPPNKIGELFYSMKYNKFLTKNYDADILFKSKDPNLNRSRVFFITSSRSASASELLINGLKPYLDVKLIGTKTHGKPVGMLMLEFQDWIILPIMFQMVNSKGYGDYFDGLPVDFSTDDDLSKNWGDSNEGCLYQVIYYISNGYFDNNAVTLTSKAVKGFPQYDRLIQKNLMIANRMQFSK